MIAGGSGPGRQARTLGAKQQRHPRRADEAAERRGVGVEHRAHHGHAAGAQGLEVPGPAPEPHDRQPEHRAQRDADRLAVEGIGAARAEHDRVGAEGGDAIVLSPRCADPFYRKAIRVSLGAVFGLPIVRLRRWPGDLQALRAGGVAVVGAVLDADATPLGGFVRPPRVALLFGAEGPGLSPGARAACDHRVTIPMSPGADSLNVATAAALFLYALRAA